MSKQNYEQQLDSWIVKEKTAVSLSNIIGNLLLDYSTELVLFRSKLKLAIARSIALIRDLLFLPGIIKGKRFLDTFFINNFCLSGIFRP